MKGEKTLVKDQGGWFFQGGADNDVIVSSRIRLSRNLTGHLFPGSMGHEEEERVRTAAIAAFEGLLDETTYEPVLIGDLRPSERRLLMERKLISQDFSLHKEKTVMLRKDMNQSCMINEDDHLKILTYRGGEALSSLYREVRDLDDKLETRVDFAASLEYGYLGPRLDNLGTAMKGSYFVHLPALVESGLVDKALKTMIQVGYEVTGFSPGEDGSLGQFFLVSNKETLGFKEEEVVEKLETLSRQLITYERMAREDLLNKKLWELEDRVFRALGVMKSCRLLDYGEGVELISSLRMGVILGWLPFPLESLNSLIILSQNSHLQARIGDGETAEELILDHERAEQFREILITPLETGGGSDV